MATDRRAAALARATDGTRPDGSRPHDVVASRQSGRCATLVAPSNRPPGSRGRRDGSEGLRPGRVGRVEARREQGRPRMAKAACRRRPGRRHRCRRAHGRYDRRCGHGSGPRRPAPRSAGELHRRRRVRHPIGLPYRSRGGSCARNRRSTHTDRRDRGTVGADTHSARRRDRGHRQGGAAELEEDRRLSPAGSGREHVLEVQADLRPESQGQARGGSGAGGEGGLRGPQPDVVPRNARLRRHHRGPSSGAWGRLRPSRRVVHQRPPDVGLRVSHGYPSWLGESIQPLA